MRKIVPFFALFFSLINPLHSQTPNYKWSVGLNIGFSEYSGDLGNGFWKFDLSPNSIYSENKISTTTNNPGMMGLSAARYLNPMFDISFSSLVGEEGFYRNINSYYYTKFGYLDATIRWKFIGKDHAKLTPYLMMGAGIRRTDLKTGNDFNKGAVNDFVIPLGAGLNIKCEERMYLNIQSYYGWTSGDKVEGSASLTRLTFDQLWHHSIGLHFLVGKTEPK